MVFNENVYALAASELEKRRQNAENLANIRRKELIKQYPVLSEIENEMKNTALSLIRSISEKKSVDVGELAKVNLDAQKKRAELLQSAGLPTDYLEPQYSCKKCNDSGYIDGRLCECHLALLKKIAAENLSCGAMLATATFENFDLKYYSEKRDAQLGYAPRDYMRASLGMIKSYAENFSQNSNSFIFSGATGLGKTHLALSIMNKVTERNFGVYYNSAWKILKQMQKEQFGKGGDDIEEEIFENDLIIIDDLGTEFESAFTKTAVFELIDGAAMAGKPMIICTNLSNAELETRYGEKVASRLNSFEVINFCGTDIRQLKK